jgi:hypothetical protein
MKKQLLLGSALLAVISAFPQSSRTTKPSGIVDMTKIVAAKFAVEPEGSVSPKLKPVIGPEENGGNPTESAVSMPPSTINWKLVTGSMNIYGMLVSQSRPLQYNDNVNAVSFIHRKSASYVASPASGSNSGSIVSMISSNWGSTWDSTCIWADATNAGRYPQGAIYSAPGNTNIANAYVVGSGPTVAGSAFSGDFYASKKLNAFDNVASAAPNAQQFFDFTSTASVAAHGWSRQGFSSTDDGVVRSLALIQNDNAGLGTGRGVAVVKGTFNAGAFTWTTDSIIPNLIVESNGDKVMGYAPQMAWNESGTVGYVLILGAAANATNSTKGYQPVIYKTTNSGASWAMVPGIDFNNASFQPVLSRLDGINTNSNIVVPYFFDYNMVVDANNKLHVGATLIGTARADNDSLGYINTYSLSIDQSSYYWPHVPGFRPYLYDFIGDGTSAWTYKLVDSISTEAAGASTGSNGFNDNPWDATGTNGSKTDNVDTRIQLGRTPDGQYITFAWAESDTNQTVGGRKYNSLPNIKTRCMAIGTGTNMYVVSPTEINVTKVAPGTGTTNPNVQNKATMHYMSPTTGAAAVTGNTVDINTPISVTNSNPFSQLTNNTTWIQAGKLSYSFASLNSGLKDNLQNSLNYEIFPNPTSSNVVLSIELKDNSNVELVVLNTIGQVVKSTKTQGFVGQNNITIDLTGLSTGVYMVNVKVGNTTNTKKLIVQ